MAAEGLHGWAETTVYPATEGGKASPSDGDTCPVCGEALKEGERVFRVTDKRYGEEWVHEAHIEKRGLA